LQALGAEAYEIGRATLTSQRPASDAEVRRGMKYEDGACARHVTSGTWTHLSKASETRSTVNADIHGTTEGTPVPSIDKILKGVAIKGGSNSTIYGKDARTGLWTFLISADGPNPLPSTVCLALLRQMTVTR